ncbi:MAG: phosphorylase [Okeania sp. SIO2D1]|nr:phosphorylase [Okeania sp. SIO2D1]
MTNDQDKLTSRGQLQLESGTLWTKVKQQSDHALQCSALLSIPTDYELVEDHGITFLVRILVNLVRKEQAKKQEKKHHVTPGKEFNPFLPYEEDLFVSDISQTHLCLLNKFNVVNHHLLIVTKAFEKQESWLNLADFEALWACLREIDGLGFYNGGKLAGASQRHKHLQLVPFPFVPEECTLNLPIEEAVATVKFEDYLGTVANFPFRHAIAKFDLNLSQTPAEAALVSLGVYQKLIQALGLGAPQQEGTEQSGAYNLLVTREWMLLVARSRESFQTVPINSLGFAGSLFVRNQEQLKIIRQQGPMKILQSVGFTV